MRETANTVEVALGQHNPRPTAVLFATACRSTVQPNNVAFVRDVVGDSLTIYICRLQSFSNCPAAPSCC
jgi:hypothetical protein